MPRRNDIEKILIIGSGPIIIGQACEFDYSGTQAVKVLKEDGYKVVLVNSNPATIMTDPNFADATYIEPITPDVVAKIIEKERPDVLLPTLGGQTALNVAVSLAESGVLERYGVELIGAKLEAIKKAEDRSLFKEAMQKIGVKVPESSFAYTVDEAVQIATKIGFPVVVRPSFTLGGTGGGIAANLEELTEMVRMGLFLSPTTEVLIERSVFGWKEFELEVMKDSADNVVIICSIENFDPMGVHTGDSITVAPAQTLTDREYQHMRDTGVKIIREIGVETGGSNIQFAVHPESGELVVIEMNPRVSRSSALASKATGFPIAKIAAKLAVGYRLDEIVNDITRETPASFEPTIDYVVVKIPRFAFEKFPETDPTLTIKMKSVGEAMAIGRTFKEAFQKAIRSLEIDRFSLFDGSHSAVSNDELEVKLRVPNEERPFYIRKAILSGYSVPDIARITKIDTWFIDQLKQIIDLEAELSSFQAKDIPRELLKLAKEFGFSDAEIARLTCSLEADVREHRKKLGIVPVYKMVDTCAAEFEAFTPYYYSTYEEETEVLPSSKEKVLILGSGPNRIGQGIEFDYCCVHASFALEELGYESIMLNCNPETVSTDYDTSDRLYFEPLTFEDVMNVIEAERPVGVILQFGGQTPLKLAHDLQTAGVKILGTSPDSIDLAEDRKRFSALADKLEIPLPECGTAFSYEEALVVAKRIGYPLLVRPSYVLGGRAMEIVYSDDMLEGYIQKAARVSPKHPILLDKFLEGAIEVDVDALADGREVYIGGMIEHVEEAGIHSGDSACAIPPYTLSATLRERLREMTIKLATELSVLGLINIQFAIKDDFVYCLEVNPRASRTVPFVSKATGVQMAKAATKIIMGSTLADLGLKETPEPGYVSVKEAVLPFGRFPEVDTLLGPEMKSTGEVMGVGRDFGEAFAKAQMATYLSMPASGTFFISVADRDKSRVTGLARRLHGLGFGLVSTKGTAAALTAAGVPCETVNKVSEGHPNVVDLINDGKVKMVINTPWGRGARTDGYEIRTAAAQNSVPCITTLQAADALVEAVESLRRQEMSVAPIQEWHATLT